MVENDEEAGVRPREQERRMVCSVCSERREARSERRVPRANESERRETCAQERSARCGLYIGGTGAILALRRELSETLVIEKRASHSGADHRLQHKLLHFGP